MGTEHRQVDETTLDRFVAQLLRRTGEGMTRRSLLSRASMLMLALAGGGTATTLFPTDARASGCAGSNCSNWRYCGMSGVPCSSCAGGVGGDTVCPSGCSKSVYSWQYCCLAAPNNWRVVQYNDCCGCTPSPACTGCCTNRKGTGLSSWCTPYVCTLAIIIGPC